MNSIAKISVKTNTGLLLTDSVTSFVYEDCLEEDNLLQLSIYREDFIDIIDKGYLEAGTQITFTFGYAKGDMSNNYIAVITDVVPKYTENIIEITAMDFGIALRRTEDIKVWGGKTSSEIALDIANKYNMNSYISKTSNKWKYKSLPQGGKTDYDFLLELASKEKNIIFYIRGNTLYFSKRRLDDTAIMLFKYPDEDTIISFETEDTNTLSDFGMDSTNISTYKEDVLLGTTDKINETDLGTYSNEYMSGIFSTSKIILIPDNKKQAKALSEYLVKNGRLELRTGNLVIEGNVNIVPDSVITMSGKLLKRDVGNWYVKKVIHRLSDGFTTELELGKNATEQRQNKAKKIVGSVINKKSVNAKNKTKGVSKKQKTKLLHVYNANGVYIGDNVNGVFVKKKV